MKKNKLEELKENYEQIIEKNTKIKNNISTIRLILFVVFVGLLILACFKKGFVFIFPALSFISFVVVSWYHHRYLKVVDDTNFKVTILNEYLARFDDSYKRSSDRGQDLKGDLFLEADLDIYGIGGLFGYLSFAKTPYGRKFLSDSLKSNIISEADLVTRQEAIHELASRLDDTIAIEGMAIKFSQENDKKKISSLENAFNLLSNNINFNTNKLFINIIYILLFVSSIILSILKFLPVYFPVIVIFIGYILGKLLYKEADGLGSAMQQINTSFYGYNYLLNEIQNKKYDSKLLNEYQKDINNLNAKSIKSFKVLSGFLNSRNNIIFQVLFNGILLLDGILVYLFILWQNKYENDFKNAIVAIGHFEELMSLATIEIVKDGSRPEISSKFSFDEIKHPLIEENRCVANSFNFKGTNIITGSNMSGKTTFMRSIGVNYILFLSGAFVCAKHFEAPICKLFTSMKVVDDVNNNISTFYGEILRVKDICAYIKTKEPMIVLVDEIFKGTNTKDRITGATAFAKKLIEAGSYAIITTHDSELCQIEGVSNYYFLEHYVDDKIAFDYTIREGVSNTRNAIYLLKMAGIMD